MPITIEPAVADDSAALTALAHAAKRHWGYPESWIVVWRDELTLSRDFIEQNHVLAARRGNVIVGCGALIDPEPSTDAAAISRTCWSLEHMWLDPEAIGSGLGRRLFDALVDIARRDGAHQLEIYSDPNAEGFYLHLGATRHGVFETDILGQPRQLPILRFSLVE